jgi:type V secretory pathway adhesin AidA
MWRDEFAEIDAKAEAKRIGGTCVAYALYTTTPAAQRKWVGLTDEDWAKIEDMPDAFDQGVAWAAARLKERNNGH